MHLTLVNTKLSYLHMLATERNENFNIIANHTQNFVHVNSVNSFSSLSTSPPFSPITLIRLRPLGSILIETDMLCFVVESL